MVQSPSKVRSTTVSDIQGGRWDAMLRRLFSVKGPAIAPAVGAELQPVVQVIPPRGEDRILRGDKMYHGIQTGTAVAGQNSFVMLANESTNSLVTIEGIHAYCLSAAMVFSMRLGNTVNGTGPATIGGRDTRLGITLAGRAQAGTLYFGSLVAGGTLVQRRSALQQLMVDFHCPVVVAPGDCVYIFGDTVNTSINVSFAWTERLAEPGELTVV